MRDTNLIYEGIGCDVREKIEDLIAEKLGFCPMLQESEDEDELSIYLHSEYGEELTDEQYEIVEKWGFNEADSTDVIKKLLNVSIENK